MVGSAGIATEIHFADGFDEPETIAFGLPAPQLTVVAVGALCAWSLLRAPAPAALDDAAALAVGGFAAMLGWGRRRERPLLEWAWLWVRFLIAPRRGGGIAPCPAALLAETYDDGHGEAAPAPPAATAGSPAATEPDAMAEPAGPKPPDDEPPWARWLREGGARRVVPAPWSPSGAAAPSALEGAEREDGDSGGGPGVDVPDAALTPPADTDSPAADSTAPPASPRWWERRRALAQSRELAGIGQVTPTPPPERTEAARTLRSATRRLPLVLVPGPVRDASGSPGGDGPTPGGTPDAAWRRRAETEDDVVDSDDADTGARVLRLPVADEVLDDGHMLELADSAVAASDSVEAFAAGTPVFVGAPRRIAFFALKGGSGRTTLATEVACLLAARARQRVADGSSRPLRVALVDLDLRSASVAVRLGIPQPTIWDLLMEPPGTGDDIDRFMVRHPSGLRALLGPPKPLAAGAPVVEPARIAEIVQALEREGAQFLVFDTGADLGAVTTWVLGAVHDIFVVITPTAGGIQDAYRSTEALRRLGVGHKLQYVVNRSRGHLDLDVVMSDLGGRIAATIPYDQRIEDAENRHRSATLAGSGPAADALCAFAAHIYPGLARPRRRRRLRFLGRGRVG